MAKTVLHTYENKEQLFDFIEEHNYFASSEVFVQIITKNQEKEFFTELYQFIISYLPSTTILGISTDNGILEGKQQQDHTRIVFTSFRDTKVNSIALHSNDFDSNELMGDYFKENLIKQHTKALMLYAIGKEVNPEKVLSNYSNFPKEIALLGGAIKNERSVDNYLAFLNGEFIENGIVAITFSGLNLKAYVYQTVEYNELGPIFQITKAKNKLIQEINGQKAQHFLRNLLGYEKLDLTKGSLFQFPLLLGHKKTPAFVIRLSNNGAVELSRQVEVGTTVNMSIVNYEKVISDAIKNIKNLSRKNIETIFTVNCTGINSFMEDFSRKQLEDLQLIAPTIGYYSKGEIIRTKDNDIQFTGMAITYLGLTENEQEKREIKKKTFAYEPPIFYETIHSLIHLIGSMEERMKEANNNLENSKKLYQLLFDKTEDLICSINAKEEILTVNQKTLTQFHKKKEDLVGKKLSDIIRYDEYLKIQKYNKLAFEGKEQYFSTRLKADENSYHDYMFQQIPFIEDGKVDKVYSIGRNITLLKEYEEKIATLSQMDSDTGLPNRATFIQKLNRTIKLAKNKKAKFSLIGIDIDRFKKINDHLGHHAGDTILRQLAHRIEKSLDSKHYLGRFSEDKFFILLQDVDEEEHIKKITTQILQEIAKPIYYKGKELYLTGSIGVSLFPSDGKAAGYLLKNTDIAIDIAKFNGGNQMAFFANAMAKDSFNRLELESALHMALTRNELEIHYQPLLNIQTNKIVSAEALLRWNSKTLGNIPPSEFIPIAEETGMINSIGKWVLFEACRQLKEWQSKGINIGVSVNVSVKQFQQPTFVSHVESILQKTNLDSKYLTLELTESATLEDIDYSIETIKSLQSLGVKIAVDDFGTGYSSLSYLKNLPINILKLDRSFIAELDRDTSDYSIVQAIIMMTKGLKVKVLAEGVETKNQLDILKELNCDYVQGYYISKPVPKEELLHKLK